jgi:hypothetical protein
MLSSAALMLCWTAGVRSYTYDSVQPWKAPLVATGADGVDWVGCKSGCARWAQLAADGSAVNQTAADLLWHSRDAQVAAGSSCAQPGGSPFDDESQTAGYAGSWCFCAHAGIASPVASYCGSPTDRNVPEQINLLLTGPRSATVAFVTFGGHNTSSVPVVEFGTDPTLSATSKVTGVTHSYQSPGSSNGGGASHPTPHQPVRPYSMHFVPLQGLRERTTYYYRVRSVDAPPPPPPPPPVKSCAGWVCTAAQQGALCKKGSPGASDRDNRCCDKRWHRSNGPPGSPAPQCAAAGGGAEWSDVFSFKSLYSSGETKFAIFGDMVRTNGTLFALECIEETDHCYQDRIGTNIGKPQTQECRVSAGPVFRRQFQHGIFARRRGRRRNRLLSPPRCGSVLFLGAILLVDYTPSVCQYRLGTNIAKRLTKPHCLLEFSLCLSRACLGKMIVLMSKWRNNGPFLQVITPIILAALTIGAAMDI